MLTTVFGFVASIFASSLWLEISLSTLILRESLTARGYAALCAIQSSVFGERRHDLTSISTST
jgi:hypothetical protein